MKTFTIDPDNNISVFVTQAEAAAASTTPFDSFSSQKEMDELAGNWPAERLVAIWNSLPGVTPVERFKDRKTGISRVWKRIQSLGNDGAGEQKQESEEKPKAAARAAKGGSAKGKSGKKGSAAKKAPKGSQKAKAAKEDSGPREGSKTAQVVVMLQRKNGASISEIMDKMGWQQHTVRGFMAGAMKKAGYEVESFKPEGGERTYRINK